MKFPIDLSEYRQLSLDCESPEISEKDLETLESNVSLLRDAIVFFTAYAGIKGLGGHTGGAYDIVPEVLIADAFAAKNDDVAPVMYDEAGHRVAIQYILAVLKGHLKPEDLLHYREFNKKLPGHPEKGITPGIGFSSGRLGHLWPFVNGIAMANPGKKIAVFTSDGSLQEGNDAEAARLAAAHRLNVKIIVDDNDVTIAGHPSKYMRGYNVKKTLEGHGIYALSGQGEDLKELYSRMQKAFSYKGPVAVVNKRPMAPGIPGIEGSPKAHDVIDAETAVRYLESRGRKEAADFLRSAKPQKKSSALFVGSSEETAKNRDEFGKILCGILEKYSPEERKAKFLVIDCDLEGSQGLHHIHKRFPEIYVAGGVMERGNFSAAAGFGSEKGKQGIIATFSAFLEMVISEITMARLNGSNVLAHFSHAGVDYMADNTSHFGINNLFAANALPENDNTMLYFPADADQMRAVLNKVFAQEGMRFVFSTRSPVPFILKEDGSRFFGEGYEFAPGKDELVRKGRQGAIVSYGEMLYRSLDAVERMRKEGMDIALINKPTLNVPDNEMLDMLREMPFVLVVESQNTNTGLGIRFGTWLLRRGFKGRYSHMGAVRTGQGGLEEQIPYQGLAPEHIMEKARSLL